MPRPSSYPAESPAMRVCVKRVRRERLGARILFPTPGLSTDNAAMIAAAAFRKFEAGHFAGLDLAAKANLPLEPPSADTDALARS